MNKEKFMEVLERVKNENITAKICNGHVWKESDIEDLTYGIYSDESCLAFETKKDAENLLIKIKESNDENINIEDFEGINGSIFLAGGTYTEVDESCSVEYRIRENLCIEEFHDYAERIFQNSNYDYENFDENVHELISFNLTEEERKEILKSFEIKDIEFDGDGAYVCSSDEGCTNLNSTADILLDAETDIFIDYDNDFYISLTNGRNQFYDKLKIEENYYTLEEVLKYLKIKDSQEITPKELIEIVKEDTKEFNFMVNTDDMFILEKPSEDYTAVKCVGNCIACETLEVAERVKKCIELDEKFDDCGYFYDFINNDDGTYLKVNLNNNEDNWYLVKIDDDENVVITNLKDDDDYELQYGVFRDDDRFIEACGIDGKIIWNYMGCDLVVDKDFDFYIIDEKESDYVYSISRISIENVCEMYEYEN